MPYGATDKEVMVQGRQNEWDQVEEIASKKAPVQQEELTLKNKAAVHQFSCSTPAN